MSTYFNDRNICVSLDPGFDSTKVCVNGVVMFKIPNATIDVSGKVNEFLALTNDKKANGYLVSHYIKDKEYLIGELARKETLQSDERNKMATKQGMLDSIERFQTKDFEIHLMTCLGLALAKYAIKSKKEGIKPEIDLNSEKDGFNTCRIVVGIALPNDWVDDVWPEIAKFLIAEHRFSVDTDEGTYDLHFTIEDGHAMALSQAKCALLGLASNDNGEMDLKSDVLSNLPCLVIDGGYKTVGIFELTTAHKVASAESNTDFAMSNVHKNTAKILQEKYGRADIKDFQIPAYIEKKEPIRYLTEKDGKRSTKQVDIYDIVNREEEKICEQLIEYIDEKFEHLLNINEIVITGGTGAAYFKQFQRFLEDEREYLKGHIILTEYEFCGKKIDPSYAIVVGMYKTLKNILYKQLHRSTGNTNSSKKGETNQQKED